MAETCSESVQGGWAETQGRAPCLPHVPHNSTEKQDPNCKISALFCCLRQMVQLQAMMGFVSKHQKGSITSDMVFELSLKKSHFKVIHSCLCQGVLTKCPEKVPLPVSSGRAVSYRFPPKNLKWWLRAYVSTPGEVPHGGSMQAAEQPLTSHRQDLAALAEGSDTGRRRKSHHSLCQGTGCET